MQHIKKHNIPGEMREQSLNVLVTKIDVLVVVLRNALSLSDLARIQIKSEDRLPATALAQIKRQQTDTASDIENRLGRAAQEFVRGGINGIAAQFAAHVAAEPTLGKLRGDPGAGRPVFARVASPVFHLLRIIALPD